MLSNSRLLATASAYVRGKWGQEWAAVRPFELSEPAGLFFWVGRVDRGQYLDGPLPFFIFADSGRIVQFTNAILVSSLTKQIATHPAFVNAVSRPDFTGSGHEAAYTEFVQECLTACAAADGSDDGDPA